MAQAIIRSLAVNAAKGNIGRSGSLPSCSGRPSARTSASTTSGSTSAISYKIEWERELDRRAAARYYRPAAAPAASRPRHHRHEHRHRSHRRTRTKEEKKTYDLWMERKATSKRSAHTCESVSPTRRSENAGHPRDRLEQTQKILDSSPGRCRPRDRSRRPTASAGDRAALPRASRAGAGGVNPGPKWGHCPA